MGKNKKTIGVKDLGPKDLKNVKGGVLPTAVEYAVVRHK